MVVLHAQPGCDRCLRLAEALDELPLAHEVVCDASGCPRLEDGDERLEGHRRIARRLEGLEERLEKWHHWSSDTCYCSEDEP